ncbi:PorP/SprF family type IX secretion system membrane protein [Fulvivirga lutea]|uniref:PorP/SprF family type IX secretion system membrane protein n=1 Tax=Fulvivirga lutea TaxID=2810512 RepID=A0A974WHD2_9BACT|nr:PorP/SprF family type IX secretion system membrane protein [Fulvivirga lutea]QSE97748.1 PorP/SprF family type IX secretion system membrane protein [Fulvivirga lutea]
MSNRWLKVLIVIVIFLPLTSNVQGQDAVFSQFFNSTLYLNPALAGIEPDVTVSFGHRSQWQNLLFPYTTSQFSAIVPYYKNKHQKPLGHVGALGVSVYSDVAGEDNNFKTTGGNITGAYNLPLDKQYVHLISFGLQIGAINKRIDPDNLQWGEQYDAFIGFDASISPSEVSNLRGRTFIDINAGAFYWWTPLPRENALINSANSGLSISHLNNPNESLLDTESQQLPLLWKYHGGIVFNLSHKATASINYLIAYQDETTQNNIGSYLSYKLTTFHSGKVKYGIARLGGWYRVNDSFILLTEFETALFKVAFSYDWNTSSLRYNDRGIGTYEINLAYRFASHTPPKSRY